MTKDQQDQPFLAGYFPFYNYFAHNPAFNNFPTLPTAAAPPPPVTEPTEISQVGIGPTDIYT